ncbi:UV-stimulated scaffold protein A homolog [Linum grandiflorum]
MTILTTRIKEFNKIVVGGIDNFHFSIFELQLVSMDEEHGGGRRDKVRDLIQKATDSTAGYVDSRLLTAIKSTVRYSDSELRLAAQTLMELMKRDHSQVRYLSLLIVDELFMRSKLFRSIMVENLDQLLTLSVGFKRNLPLPAPPAVASVLRSKAIEFLEKWNASFGVHYRQIRLGFDYLKNTLRLQFPNIQGNIARIRQERREREARSKEILQNKFESLKENLSGMKEEIQETIDEINQCLEIVTCKEEDRPLSPIDEEDYEEFRPLELQQIRINSLKEAEKVQEDAENRVVFDTLREHYKLLVTKHLVSVQESISVLIRVEVTNARLRNSMLKDLIDFRNQVQSVKKKCAESGCSLPAVTKTEKEDEEDDFWEECKFDSTRIGCSSESNKPNGSSFESSTSKKSLESGDSNSKRIKPSDRDGRKTDSKSDPLKSKLLEEAPVLEWGSFLDNWGPNRDVLANHRGMEIENHWGRVDNDAVIPAERIAELNLSASLYKEEQVEIQPCRAPLRKGGLCPRRDLRVCPFHGPIIPRDDQGNPIIQSTPTDHPTSLDPFPKSEHPGTSMDINLAEQLAKQAVENVRNRENDDANKRKMEKQSMKRAKRAKIREHNEAVLKDAALASTSRSEWAGEEDAGRLSSRNKKETLASMLRTKVTRKDRLSQRLLNTKASDATVRQLTQGADATYREAFPNQW